MKNNLYLAQMCRKNKGDWDGFKAHLYAAYNEADEGDIVDMPWGEKAVLLVKKTGAVFLNGTYTDEEYDEGANIVPAVKYVFISEDGIFHTQFYMGEMYMYDYPTINEYHHQSAFEIDPNDYEIDGYFEPTGVDDIETVKKHINSFINK